MNSRTKRRFTRRLADKIRCLRQGHVWATTELTFGEVSLLRTDCTRCGQIGPLHGTEHRSVDVTSRAAVG